MVKLICAIIIIISCSYVGMKMSGELSGRVKNLKDILWIVGKIEGYITALKMPAQEIYQSFAEEKGSIGQMFKSINEGNSFEKELNLFSSLTEGDRKIALDFFNSIGSFDYERQLDQAMLTQELLREQLNLAKTDFSDNSKVYRAMSFFTGVVIAILLI